MVEHAGPTAQLRGMVGLAVALEQRGAGDDDPANPAHRNRDHRRVFERADPDADVETLFDELDDAVEQQQVDPHPGMRAHELRHGRRHVALAEEHGRRRANLPARLGAASGHGLLRLLDVRQDPAAAIEVDAPLLGERHLSGGADEQPHAQVGLEGRQRAHHRGRSPVERLRGRREAALLDDPDEGPHGCQHVHRLRLVGFPE